MEYWTNKQRLSASGKFTGCVVRHSTSGTGLGFTEYSSHKRVLSLSLVVACSQLNLCSAISFSDLHRSALYMYIQRDREQSIPAQGLIRMWPRIVASIAAERMNYAKGICITLVLELPFTTPCPPPAFFTPPPLYKRWSSSRASFTGILAAAIACFLDKWRFEQNCPDQSESENEREERKEKTPARSPRRPN